MRPRLKPEDQMTIDEFLAFTDQRPDGERWELIEGVAIMNASPVDFHQIIAGNIYMALAQVKLTRRSIWTPALGIGTRVPSSPNSLLQPDVFVKEALPTGHASTDDALVLFEVLSKSNTKADQAWRRRVYASIPNCQHYVTVSQAAVAITRYDRASAWQGVDSDRLDSPLALPALGDGVSIAVGDIYRWTPLATA